MSPDEFELAKTRHFAQIPNVRGNRHSKLAEMVVNASLPIMKARSLIIRFILICIISCICHAEQIGYLDSGAEQKDEKLIFETACSFYGLEIERIPIVVFGSEAEITNVISKKKFRAIATDASSFYSLERSARLNFLRVLRMKQIPLLIFGIDHDTSADFLLDCSQGSLSKCQKICRSPNKGYFRIEKMGPLTRQLSGIEFPYVGNVVSYFCCDHDKAKPIIQLSDANIPGQFPIFVEIKTQGEETFFLVSNQLNKTAGLQEDKRVFSKKHMDHSISRDDLCILRLLPFLIFLRYTYDQVCWHSSTHFANLTIDDPWLTNPYGYLNFSELLEQMKSHNFHTTIGFIPWNYDRSIKEVVDLFTENQDRYSICLHGNNHDHREFPENISESTESSESKLLAHQEENIKQALARMEKFWTTTRIPYDKIMIFPHGIAPEYALRLLKKYNFLATINANNVPLGSSVRSDLNSQLRSLTMKYENFPSLKRYGPNRSVSDVALDLFLDNPILFYAHHDYFRSGINSFNNVAEKVNRIQPDIEWKNLGYIIKHFYLERMITDNDVEVMAFSNSIVIENSDKRELKYHIQKAESFSLPIKRIVVDDMPYPYKKANNQIEFDILIPKGESRHISIEYENELDIPSINISKEDARVNRLRRLSDYRDMKLSKNSAGRLLIKSYYETGLYRVGMKRIVVAFLVIIIFSILGIMLIIRKKRK
jgi:hypothetical protein